MVDPGSLSDVTLFRGLSSEQLEKLTSLLHEQALPPDTNLVTAEEAGGVAYLILSGTVKVYVTRTGGSKIILTVLGPGEVVGEMSFADSLGCSASVLTAA